MTPEDYICKAAQLGDNIKWAMTYILEQVKDKIRQDKIAQGLLSLANHYQSERLEQVCKYIKPCGTISIEIIKNVLSNNIDLVPLEDIEYNIPYHENVRGIY